MSTDSVTAESDLVAALRRAQERRETARDRVEAIGEAELERLQEVYREFIGVLERYEEPVVEDGEAKLVVEFQSAVADVLGSVPDDLRHADVFEACGEHLKGKWFKTADFDRVRDELEPVADDVERLTERQEAESAYRKARRRLEGRIRELEGEIADLERLERLGAADLDAPTERLRDPIETYNDAVTEAFATFRREASAREVMAFLDAMAAYPLVEFEEPSDALREYVSTSDAGEESIPRLLDLAGYSRSKLDHYVSDPAALTEAVGGKRTYLDRLDAAPLRVEWPPPDAETLGWRCRELTAAVNRFAPEVVEHVRTVAALPRETDYERLRDAALATEDLSEAEREHIASGDIEDELAAARTELERLREGLETHG